MLQGFRINIRALIITYTILGFPYYSYSIVGPKPYSSYQGPYITLLLSDTIYLGPWLAGAKVDLVTGMRTQGLGFRV